jgi:hypothetical protein
MSSFVDLMMVYSEEYYAERQLKQLTRTELQDKAIELGVRPYQLSGVLIDEILKMQYERTYDDSQKEKKRKT